jgi:hypothetical protein
MEEYRMVIYRNKTRGVEKDRKELFTVMEYVFWPESRMDLEGRRARGPIGGRVVGYQMAWSRRGSLSFQNQNVLGVGGLKPFQALGERESVWRNEMTGAASYNR